MIRQTLGQLGELRQTFSDVSWFWYDVDVTLVPAEM
jgi:hypothetical protein